MRLVAFAFFGVSFDYTPTLGRHHFSVSYAPRIPTWVTSVATLHPPLASRLVGLGVSATGYTRVYVETAAATGGAIAVATVAAEP